MFRPLRLCPVVLLFLQLSTVSATADDASAAGPLRVHPDNSRYFTDGSGRAVYLTGSHTWANVQDVAGYDWVANISGAGGFDAYLDWLHSYNHNFIRLWILEHAWDAKETATIAPLPWPRTGPGQGLDGKPRFDLSKFDPAYFERLQSRVAAAGKRGFYVSVMLFDSWSIEHPETWEGHPFNANNNVNGINGDPNHDGIGVETHALKIPAVTRLQEAYARKVVDTLNDLDNVLYEISNESEYGADWHYHLIQVIKNHEALKTKQHPVGMTGAGPTNAELFQSKADWISPDARGPRKDSYKTNPPAADGAKVIILDTDHLGAVKPTWVWKSFVRGHNPILMDWMDKRSPWYTAADQEAMRKAMGDTRRYAEKTNLAALTPRSDLASTTYCLANPAKQDAEYLVYLPEGGTVQVDLNGSEGSLAVEWFNPKTGNTTAGENAAGGSSQQFRAPFAGDAVLYLGGSNR